MPQAGVLHHVELYVSSLESSKHFWAGFLGELGYKKGAHWDSGATYELGDTYITLVQTEAAFLEPAYHCKRVGLNHRAFHAASREQVDSVTQWVQKHRYKVVYEDKHPLAGGADYSALYCEDPDRMKVELVAPFLD